MMECYFCTRPADNDGRISVLNYSQLLPTCKFCADKIATFVRELKLVEAEKAKKRKEEDLKAEELMLLESLLEKYKIKYKILEED